MPAKPVVAYPNEILRYPTKEVSEVNDNVRAFCLDLAETMEVATGAGLAAPQVATNLRIFVISKHVAKAEEHVHFINPKVLEVKGAQTNKEGCLSFPSIFLNVERPASVLISHLDLDGKEQVTFAEGYYAQAICHEMDHLEGILLVDHAKPVKKGLIKRKMKKLAGRYLDYRPRGEQWQERPSSNVEQSST